MEKDFKLKEINHETFKNPIVGLMFRIEASFYNVKGLDIDITTRYVSQSLIQDDRLYSINEILKLSKL